MNLELLTKEFAEPFWLVIVLHGHTESVEKHQDDDKPVEPLLLDGTPDPESASLRKMMSHNGIHPMSKDDIWL